LFKLRDLFFQSSKGLGLIYCFPKKVKPPSKSKALLFDPFSSPQDLFPPSKVHIRWSNVVQRLMIALVVVVVNKVIKGCVSFLWAVIMI